MGTEINIKQATNRFKYVFITTIAIGIFAIAKIISIQFFASEIVSEEDIFDDEPIVAIRGSILSSDGKPLALSTPIYEIRMDCTVSTDSLFNSEIDDLAKSLSALFRDKSSNSYKNEIIAARKRGNKYKRLGNRDVDYIDLESIEKFPILREGRNTGGLRIVNKSRRENPYDMLAVRTIGNINAVGDGVGIENSHDYRLSGIDGNRKVQRQLGGDWIPVSGAPVTRAIDGYDIKTTIDIDIQETADKALTDQLETNEIFEGGTAIVMEVETGAIKAIANKRRGSNGKFTESYNYAIMDATEPGSTMKLASLISMLEDGVVTLDTEVDGEEGEWYYGGVKFSDTRKGGHGMLTMKEAFEKSSNVAFSKLITEHYEGREEEFVSRFHSMKIGEYFQLDILGEGRSNIIAPGSSSWSKSSLPMMSIGYASLITPLHTLAFYNAVANNGKMMKPYLIESYQRNGIVEIETKPEIVSGSICSKKTIKHVTEALEGVVQNGTATSLKDPRYRIAGKTGTAQIAFRENPGDKRMVYVDQNGRKKYQASFAGFFPADNPKYTCVVVLYTGKTRANFYGGTWAAPIFKKISDEIFISHPEWKKPLIANNAKPEDIPSIASGRASEINLLSNLLPLKESISSNKGNWVSIGVDDEGGEAIKVEPIMIEKGIVPQVENMGLKDALFILENEGYQVHYNVLSKGRVVSQSPKAGSIAGKNTKITIELSGSI